MKEKWEPLEARLGCARCGGFMFMGSVNGIYSTSTVSADGICSSMIKDEHTKRLGGMGFARFHSRKQLPASKHLCWRWARHSKQHTILRISGEKMRHCARLASRCCGFELRRKMGQYKLPHAGPRPRSRGFQDAVN